MSARVSRPQLWDGAQTSKPGALNGSPRKLIWARSRQPEARIGTCNSNPTRSRCSFGTIHVPIHEHKESVAWKEQKKQEGWKDTLAWTSTKSTRWSWDMDESARLGLTYKQFAKYALLKLGVETDITRFVRKDVPRRVASNAETLARMAELGLSL